MTANSRFLGKIGLFCPFFGDTLLRIGQLPTRLGVNFRAIETEPGGIGRSNAPTDPDPNLPFPERGSPVERSANRRWSGRLRAHGWSGIAAQSAVPGAQVEFGVIAQESHEFKSRSGIGVRQQFSEVNLIVGQSPGEQRSASQSLHIALGVVQERQQLVVAQPLTLQPERSNRCLPNFGIGILDERREEFERSTDFDGHRNRTQAERGQRSSATRLR